VLHQVGEIAGVKGVAIVQGRKLPIEKPGRRRLALEPSDSGLKDAIIV
jgi:hypothetical protein